MSADIRDYLLERFTADATTLRQRAAALANTKKPASGPTAAVSTAMADACDRVVRLAQALPEDASVDEIVDALNAMLPELAALANAKEAADVPPVRAVYLGATTRVQELIAAETGAQQRDTDSDDDGSDE